MKPIRYVTDESYREFKGRVPRVIALAMDLSLLTGHDLSALLELRWQDVKAIGLPRDKWVVEIGRLRSEKPRSLQIAAPLEQVLKSCKMMLPHWPREFVLRRDDGGGMSVKEFNAIWNLYMRRWAGIDRPAFAFREIRTKALFDLQVARKAARRRTPRRGSIRK